MQPKLRFKNFTKKWSKKKLGEVVTVSMGQSPNGENYSTNPTNTVLIQGNADMKNGRITPRIYTSQVTKLCTVGDIIMSVRAPVGTLAISNIEACIGRGVCAIKGNEFVYYWLENFNRVGRWKKLSQGSTFESVNSNDIKALKLYVPEENEQRKIASLFTLMNQKIAKQEEKIEQLVTYKKGLLQKIFSKKIRFKDDNGNEFPEWEICNLNKLGTFEKTYSFSRSEEGEGEYQHIHYGDIHSKFSGIINIDTAMPTLSINPDTDLTIIKKNDIIFADASEDTNDLGKSIVVLDIDEKKIISGLHTFCFRPNSNVNSLFLHYFTQTNEYKRFIYRNATGTSVYGLSKSNLAKLKVPLPCTEEQEQIAHFLYKINQKVELLNDQLFELQTLKKGLMQKMFV